MRQLTLPSAQSTFRFLGQSADGYIGCNGYTACDPLRQKNSVRIFGRKLCSRLSGWITHWQTDESIEMMPAVFPEWRSKPIGRPNSAYGYSKYLTPSSLPSAFALPTYCSSVSRAASSHAGSFSRRFAIRAFRRTPTSHRLQQLSRQTVGATSIEGVSNSCCVPSGTVRRNCGMKFQPLSKFLLERLRVGLNVGENLWYWVRWPITNNPPLSIYLTLSAPPTGYFLRLKSSTVVRT